MWGKLYLGLQRNALYNSARNSGVWSYVEPISLTPTWVHFDKRFGTPACSTGGFPLLRRGSISNYVLIAQDDLNTLGFRTGGLDGIFGTATRNAVINYQRSRGLSADRYCWMQHLAFSTRKCYRNSELLVQL